MGFTGVWGNGALGVYDEGGISYRRVPMAETEKEHGGTHDLARVRTRLHGGISIRFQHANGAVVSVRGRGVFGEAVCSE